MSSSPASCHQPAGFSALLGKNIFKTALQGLWKISSTQPEEAAVSAVLSSSPSMLPVRMECCALGASLATVLFQKYSAFSKNIQSYPSALQLFGFDSNYSMTIRKAETTTQLFVQLWKKKLTVHSFSSLSSCQP